MKSYLTHKYCGFLYSVQRMCRLFSDFQVDSHKKSIRLDNHIPVVILPVCRRNTVQTSRSIQKHRLHPNLHTVTCFANAVFINPGAGGPLSYTFQCFFCFNIPTLTQQQAASQLIIRQDQVLVWSRESTKKRYRTAVHSGPGLRIKCTNEHTANAGVLYHF